MAIRLKWLIVALLLCCALAVVVKGKADPIPSPIGVAVFLCNEWQGISVFEDGVWYHYGAWRIADDPELQDLIRGIELEEIRLGNDALCSAFKST